MGDEAGASIAPIVRVELNTALELCAVRGHSMTYV